MDEAELLTAVAAHDTLLRRCALGEMTYAQFEAEYDSFFQRWALDGHESDPAEQAILLRHADPLAVRRRVWEEVLVRATSEQLARLPQSQHAGFVDPSEAQRRIRSIAGDAGLFDLGTRLLAVAVGDVASELRDEDVLEWISKTAAAAQLTACVCTGAFLLAAAGVLEGRGATTHWEDLVDLRRSFRKCKSRLAPMD